MSLKNTHFSCFYRKECPCKKKRRRYNSTFVPPNYTEEQPYQSLNPPAPDLPQTNLVHLIFVAASQSFLEAVQSLAGVSQTMSGFSAGELLVRTIALAGDGPSPSEDHAVSRKGRIA